MKFLETVKYKVTRNFLKAEYFFFVFQIKHEENNDFFSILNVKCFFLFFIKKNKNKQKINSEFFKLNSTAKTSTILSN